MPEEKAAIMASARAWERGTEWERYVVKTIVTGQGPVCFSQDHRRIDSNGLRDAGYECEYV